jgi:dihydrofolate synthase / folylpolyglutamate synthase
MPVAQLQTVAAWLEYIESLHPKVIDMGLERVLQVANRLTLKFTCPVITIGGTNGKGSTCAMLSTLYVNAGYKVGTYTSPHILTYQERVQVNQINIDDISLCNAFAAIENVRGDTDLTYFEMGTLAALWHFCQQQLDVVILEVGLGGRLDAVNIIDADCAIVTNVDLDHTDYLGDTREAIGFEKAGIYRKNKIAICGDENPPNTLLNYAKTIQAQVKVIQRDFTIKKNGTGWTYIDEKGHLSIPQLGLKGDFQSANAAIAIYAVRQLNQRLPVEENTLTYSLQTLHLMGRFQYLQTNPDVIMDVAHNAQAAESLVANIKNLSVNGKVVAVFSMLADKDIQQVVKRLSPFVAEWHIAKLEMPRGATLAELNHVLKQHVTDKQIFEYDSVANASEMAYNKLEKNDKMIVFGSFFTVAAALTNWQKIVAHAVTN